MHQVWQRRTVPPPAAGVLAADDKGEASHILPCGDSDVQHLQRQVVACHTHALALVHLHTACHWTCGFSTCHSPVPWLPLNLWFQQVGPAGVGVCACCFRSNKSPACPKLALAALGTTCSSTCAGSCVEVVTAAHLASGLGSDVSGLGGAGRQQLLRWHQPLPLCAAPHAPVQHDGCAHVRHHVHLQAACQVWTGTKSWSGFRLSTWPALTEAAAAVHAANNGAACQLFTSITTCTCRLLHSGPLQRPSSAGLGTSPHGLH